MAPVAPSSGMQPSLALTDALLVARNTHVLTDGPVVQTTGPFVELALGIHRACRCNASGRALASCLPSSGSAKQAA